MTIPNRLRLKDGKLVLDDGSDPTEYLKAWAERYGITEDTPVNVVEHDEYWFLFMSAGIG